MLFTDKQRETLKTISDSLRAADVECHKALIWSDDYPELKDSILEAYTALSYARGYVQGKRWAESDKLESEEYEED